MEDFIVFITTLFLITLAAGCLVVVVGAVLAGDFLTAGLASVACAVFVAISRM